MSARYLRLINLRLEGFGPYRGPREFHFPPGLGVFVGPNETGKSTMAAAISAAFFGLPGTADPAAFGIGRYRNWDDPRRFEVAVEFDVDGVLYRLKRSLDTHRIGLFRRESEGWLQVVGGEHNPNAKKPNAPFNRWLSETFGHASRELFEATFSLRQPFAAADRLDGELQSLLSGGGSGHLGALERLVEEAKALTYRTGELGLTPRDGRKSGRLDAVREAIRTLASEIASGRELVDELQSISREIAEFTGELNQKRERLGTVRRNLSAFAAWRHHVQKVRDRGDDVAHVRRALQQLRRIEEELSRERSALEREFPELDQAAPLDEALELLSEAVRRGEEIGRLANELASIERALDEVGRIKSELIPWEIGREGALGWFAGARRAFEDARREWNTYLRLAREREALLQRRMGEYRAFEEAAPASLERIGEFRLTRSVLVERLHAARELLEKEEARLGDARSIEARLAERYADVHGRGHLLGEVDRALQLHAEAESAREAVQSHSARLVRARRVRWIAFACAPLFLLPLLIKPGPIEAVLLLALSGLCAAFGSLLLRLPRLREVRTRFDRAQKRHEALQRELDEVRRRLGSWAGESKSSLESLRSRLASYNEAVATLKESERGGPDPEQLARMREEVARQEEALAAIDREIAPFKEAFRDFEAAFATWSELRRESRAIDEELRRLLRAWGCAEGVPRSGIGAPTAGVWAALLPYARPLRLLAGDGAAEGSEEQIEALAELLGALDEGFWQELRRRAELYDDTHRREVELLAARRRLGGAERGALHEAVEGLRRVVDSLERAWPGEWRPVLIRLEQGIADDAEAVELLRALPSPLSDLVGRAGGLDEAKRRYEAFRSLKGRVAQLEARREGALQAAGCADEATLERRLAEAEASLAVAVQELESLVREFPGLPARGEEEEIEAVARRVDELEREAARLEGELERGEERVRELRRRQASLEGARPVNVAQAELELADLRREEERLDFELRAVALAHVHLEGAAEAYYAGHLERLAEGASAYFAAFSGRKGRRIAFDGDGRLLAIEADGREIPLPALSQGARDQLYLAFRLGIADLLSWNRALPFIFDDPFVNCDAVRLDSIRRSLEALADERQILLYSHREAFRSWGAPIEARELHDIAWKEEEE